MVAQFPVNCAISLALQFMHHPGRPFRFLTNGRFLGTSGLMEPVSSLTLCVTGFTNYRAPGAARKA
jgi:hypothetical protein